MTSMTKIEENIIEITLCYAEFVDKFGPVLVDSKELKESIVEAANEFEKTEYNKEEYLDEIREYATHFIQTLYDWYGSEV